jgi:NADPH-dependent glutamate synthase beta subunit-like oxidoreductase
MDIDMVLIAAGFIHVEQSKLLRDFDIKLDPQGNIQVDPDFTTSAAGVFAAGDAVSGASLVVKAMDQGRRAADAVNDYLVHLLSEGR